LLVLPISNLVATGQVELGDSVYVDLDDSGGDVAFSKRHGTPTISDLCIPEGELNPFYGVAVQSQQVGAMA
ncbi:MAG TPA: hypothetical protein VE135_11090, partial [Pyrinomonadaceae bacterium]|nr:hypothetical protein [Pyrinomonadaceae bacterium]